MQTAGGFQRNMGQNTHVTDRFGPGFQHESRFPPYIFGKSKRIRNKNWELLEIQVLKKMIHNHRELLNSRHTNAMMNARKNLVWKRIAESINALGLHRRSIRELKIKWSNMRLTERRKVRGQYASTSGPRDGGDDSLDIVDISQSSFESEIDVDRSGEQAENIESQSVTTIDTIDANRNDQQPSLGTDRRSQTEWVNTKKQENDEQLQLPYSEPHRQTHAELPYKQPHRTTKDEWVESDKQQNNNELQTSVHQPQRTTETDWMDTQNHVATVGNTRQPGLMADVLHNRPQSWPHDDFSLNDTGSCSRSENTVRTYAPDFSKDRIYMPGVVIKPEPSDYSDVCHTQTTTTQTDWRLSCNKEYIHPSLPVSADDIAVVKYEILQLERSHLLLKNENMELQNAKLKMEISKLKNTM